jgi:N-carbamoylputrescine amidase
VSSLNVALLQLESPGPDPARALHAGADACRRAAALGADVALFPEMWQIGYGRCPRDREGRAAWLARAAPSNGPFVGRFRALARELRMAIVVTYLQAGPGAPRNAATLVDRTGTPVLTYAKVHTCDFDTEIELAPGSGFPVAVLDTAAGPVHVGMMICFDREHPESARALMLAGAEIILTPNACVLDAERIGQARARAFENMLGLAVANYATPVPLPPDDPGHCNGHSVAFSGICYDAHGAPLDHRLVEAGEEAGIFLATFDLDALRAYRAREPWGGAYRKPGAYGRLLAGASDPVFARDGHFRLARA